MKYYSTRDKNVSLSAAEAVKMGLSRDGGLLTPTRIPQIDRAFLERLIPMEYAQRAAKVMALYLTDYSEEELLTFGRNAYGPAQFDDPIAAPVRTAYIVWSCGTVPPPRSRIWHCKCCLSFCPPHCGKPAKSGQPAF